MTDTQLSPPTVPVRELLNGAWRMMECEMEGKVLRPAVTTVWAVRGEELVVRHRGVVQPPPAGAGFALVRRAGRGAVDYAVRFADRDALTLPGVFARAGDTLVLSLALGGERPADYTPGRDRIVYTFRRVPDAQE
jgi:uncharacterized protein (TIGR03067 family)